MNENVASGGEQGLFLHLFNDFIIFSEAFRGKPRLFIKNAEYDGSKVHTLLSRV